MRILVTGSEGNIGSELVPYLEKMGHDVLCLDIVQDYRKNYMVCDILHLSDIEKEVSEFHPEYVYHLAAMVSRVTCEKAPHLATLTNISGTTNIIQLCKRNNAKLINFSTSEVYGNQNVLLDEDVIPMPNNIYGLTKYLAEQIAVYEAVNNGLQCINLRPFMMYSEHENMGENRSAMIRFAENIWKNKPITVHAGAVRSWLHVSDAVAILEKLLYVNGNETINMGNLDYINIEEMAEIMCDYAGRSRDLIVKNELPDKMTLKKVASFEKQKCLTKYTPQIQNKEGIIRVMDTTKKRLGL